MLRDCCVSQISFLSLLLWNCYFQLVRGPFLSSSFEGSLVVDSIEFKVYRSSRNLKIFLVKGWIFVFKRFSVSVPFDIKIVSYLFFSYVFKTHLEIASKLLKLFAINRDVSFLWADIAWYFQVTVILLHLVKPCFDHIIFSLKLFWNEKNLQLPHRTNLLFLETGIFELSKDL